MRRSLAPSLLRERNSNDPVLKSQHESLDLLKRVKTEELKYSTQTVQPQISKQSKALSPSNLSSASFSSNITSSTPATAKYYEEFSPSREEEEEDHWKKTSAGKKLSEKGNLAERNGSNRNQVPHHNLAEPYKCLSDSPIQPFTTPGAATKTNLVPTSENPMREPSPTEESANRIKEPPVIDGTVAIKSVKTQQEPWLPKGENKAHKAEQVTDMLAPYMEDDRVDTKSVAQSTSATTLTSVSSTLMQNSYIVLCKISAKQSNLYAETVKSTKGRAIDVIDSLRDLLCHPFLLEFNDENISDIDLELSGKLCVLGRILLSIEKQERVLVFTKTVPTKLMLIRCLKELNDKVDLLIFSSFDKAEEHDKLTDRIIYFDVPSSLAPMHLDNTPIVYRLLTSGTFEENLFLDVLKGLDYEKEMKKSSLQRLSLSSTSYIMAEISDREKRFRTLPDEEFADLWPHLLELGWNAEKGGGLVDYFYCKPNYTSKSTSKNLIKQKGTKHVHFFASKLKVVASVKQDTSALQRSRLVHGLHDLVLWNRHLCEATMTPDPFMSCIACNHVMMAFSCEAPIV
jgi:hypothetical protein